jgi:hypothetical protein
MDTRRPDEVGEILGPGRGVAENLIILAAMALVTVALVAALLWGISD